MGFYAGSGNAIPNGVLTYAAFQAGSGATFMIAADATAANTSAAVPATLKTYALTNAQADFPYLIVYAYGYGRNDATGATQTTDLQVCAEDTLKGQSHNSLVSGVGKATPHATGVVLIAGTDYTQGTGFNVKIKGSVNPDSTGVLYYERSHILGVV